MDIDQDNLRIGTAKAVACLMSFAQITCIGCLVKLYLFVILSFVMNKYVQYIFFSRRVK